MKTFCLALVLLLAKPVFAWEKIVSCDGDMFVVDRQPNILGKYDYQTVFRGLLIESMIEQKIIRTDALNSSGELIKISNLLSGMVSDRVGFQLTNAYSRSGNYSVIFHNRWGQAGNYIFNSCWFKYPETTTP